MCVDAKGRAYPVDFEPYCGRVTTPGQDRRWKERTLPQPTLTLEHNVDLLKDWLEDDPLR